jgi:hypothetical protein
LAVVAIKYYWRWRRRTGWLKFGTPLLGMPLKDEHWN